MGRNRKNKKTKPYQPPTPAVVGDKVRTALRSIVRDWRGLRAPLPIDAIPPEAPGDVPHFKVRGAESFEELHEQVIQFAGRVWQLKDGLIKWLKTRPGLDMTFSDGTGRTVTGGGGTNAERTIEDAAKLSLPLLLCADLYNTHKHYDDCNRSGYQPLLNGVQFDGTNVGVWGIRYDGARKSGELTVGNACPVPVRIEIISGNRDVSFGDAVVTIGRAFLHWLPFIRNMQLLSATDKADRAILEDLATVEAEVKRADAFKPGDAAIDLSELPVEQRLLASTDPDKLIEAILKQAPTP